MKKFLGLFLSVLYLFSCNASYALSELYYINNARKDLMSKKFYTEVPADKYNVRQAEPFYATSVDNAGEFLVAVFEQNGENLYYYYDTNTNDKKTNKNFLKKIKAEKYTYERLETPSLLENFEEISQRTITGVKKVYSFDEIEQTKKEVVETNTAGTQEPEADTKLKGFVGMVGKGSILQVYLQDAINTATAKKGQQVIGILKEDWIVNKKYVIAPAGSVLYGYVWDAHPAQRGMRNGALKVAFNKLVTSQGQSYDISAEKIDFKVTDDGRVQKLATGVATSALIGAATGALFALIFSGRGETIARSALIGAGVAGGYTLVQDGVERGIDAEIPAYTDVEVEIKANVNAVLNY